MTIAASHPPPPPPSPASARRGVTGHAAALYPSKQQLSTSASVTASDPAPPGARVRNAVAVIAVLCSAVAIFGVPGLSACRVLQSACAAPAGAPPDPGAPAPPLVSSVAASHTVEHGPPSAPPQPSSVVSTPARSTAIAPADATTQRTPTAAADAPDQAAAAVADALPPTPPLTSTAPVPPTPQTSDATASVTAHDNGVVPVPVRRKVPVANLRRTLPPTALPGTLLVANYADVERVVALALAVDDPIPPPAKPRPVPVPPRVANPITVHGPPRVRHPPPNGARRHLLDTQDQQQQQYEGDATGQKKIDTPGTNALKPFTHRMAGGYFASRLDPTAAQPAYRAFPQHSGGARIAMVTAWSFLRSSKRTNEVAALSVFNKALYCRRNGYDLYVFDSDAVFEAAGYNPASRSAQWVKPLAVSWVLPRYEWVVWQDADLIAMNLSLPFERFVARYGGGGKVLIIPTESKHKSDVTELNTAHYLVKRDPVAFQMMPEQWQLSSYSSANNDQTAIRNVRSNKRSIADLIAVIYPLRLLGSLPLTTYPAKHSRYHYGDGFAHFSFCNQECARLVTHLSLTALALNGLALPRHGAVPPGLFAAPPTPPEVVAPGTFGVAPVGGAQASPLVAVVMVLPPGVPEADDTETVAEQTGEFERSSTHTAAEARRRLAAASRRAWAAFCREAGCAFDAQYPAPLFTNGIEEELLANRGAARVRSVQQQLAVHDAVVYVDAGVFPPARRSRAALLQFLDSLPPRAGLVASAAERSPSEDMTTVDPSVFVARRSAWALGLLEEVLSNNPKAKTWDDAWAPVVKRLASAVGASDLSFVVSPSRINEPPPADPFELPSYVTNVLPIALGSRSLYVAVDVCNATVAAASPAVPGQSAGGQRLRLVPMSACAQCPRECITFAARHGARDRRVRDPTPN